MIGMLLAEMLEHLGHSVCGISCTEEAAVAAAAEQLPDLIIIDARLGRGSGLAAMRQILRQSYVPHIYMSGDLLSLNAVEQGAVILKKPFLSEDLDRCIQLACNASPALAGNSPT